MTKFAMILVLAAAVSYSQWYAQPSGTNYALRSVHFIDENTGFIAGFNCILKTSNAGFQWEVVNIAGGHNFIKFVNSSTAFICGDNGKILRTTNSGTTWNELSSGSTNNLMRADFINENTGIVVGFRKTILKTTDAGANWVSLIGNNDTINLLGCSILSENKYIVTGTSSLILVSTNSGAAWNESTLGMVNPLWAPEFINENTGWITGCCGVFIKTTNAGQTWSPEIYLTLGNTVYTLEFINNITGYLCGDGGILYRTTSAGISWDSTVTGTEQILYSLFMVNSNTGWAVGNYGTILKTTNGGGQGFPIGLENISGSVPEKFHLYQNYPNPFNPNTNMKFDIAKQSHVTLKLYDMLGRETGVVVNQFLGAGTYLVNLDFSSYPSGIYFIKLEAGQFTDIRKLVFIK